MTILEAKAKLDIPAVAAQVFPQWRPALSCVSPFREDRNPSFSVYDQGQKWKDHATGDHGDAVELGGEIVITALVKGHAVLQA